MEVDTETDEVAVIRVPEPGEAEDDREAEVISIEERLSLRRLRRRPIRLFL